MKKIDNIYIKRFKYFNVYVIKGIDGDILIDSCEANILDLKASTGDIKVNETNMKDDLTIKTTTGSIKLNEVTCLALDITVDTGDVWLTDVLAKEDMNLHGDTSDVFLERFDAANIYIKTSTGDVKGTIRTSKIIFAKSSTGDIDVPETTEGGTCKITTSTGDIIISYSL